MSKADDPRYATTDGLPPRPGYQDSPAPAPIEPATGQHEAYWILSKEERAKDFIRPVRETYVHNECGSTTKMGLALAETYARDPKFYSHTFCVHCRKHYPVSEFRWVGTDQLVGS